MNEPVHKTKKDAVVELIRESILSAELKPGDRLLQDEIAQRMNVSATPVREALRQLEAEGVLAHSPHQGARVSEISFGDVRETYLIRGALEALATREAVSNIDDESLDHIKSLQAVIETLIVEDNLLELRKLNYDLHMTIYDAAHMPELHRMIRVLWTRFPWDTMHVIPGLATTSSNDHARIIKSIEACNAIQAGKEMHVHVENGAMALMKFLEKDFDGRILEDDGPN